MREVRCGRREGKGENVEARGELRWEVLAVTVKHALEIKLSIEPGNRISTSSGWVRSDRILLSGTSIGAVQVRRTRRRVDVLTIGRRGQGNGYDVDWLLGKTRDDAHRRSAA